VLSFHLCLSALYIKHLKFVVYIDSFNPTHLEVLFKTIRDKIEDFGKDLGEFHACVAEYFSIRNIGPVERLDTIKEALHHHAEKATSFILDNQ